MEQRRWEVWDYRGRIEGPESRFVFVTLRPNSSYDEIKERMLPTIQARFDNGSKQGNRVTIIIEIEGLITNPQVIMDAEFVAKCCESRLIQLHGFYCSQR
jgi:hypothetical protein